MTDLLEALTDLHKQATTERSHYYTGKLVAEAITEIAILRTTLKAIARGSYGKGYTARRVAGEMLDALNIDWRKP